MQEFAIRDEAGSTAFLLICSANVAGEFFTVMLPSYGSSPAEFSSADVSLQCHEGLQVPNPRRIQGQPQETAASKQPPSPLLETPTSGRKQLVRREGPTRAINSCCEYLGGKNIFDA